MDNPNSVFSKYPQLYLFFTSKENNFRHFNDINFATLDLSPMQRKLILAGIKFHLQHNYPQINEKNFADLNIVGLEFEEIMKAPTLRVSDYHNKATYYFPQTCIFNHSILQALLTGSMTYNYKINPPTQEWLRELFQNNEFLNQEEKKFLAEVILTEPELLLDIKNQMNNNSLVFDKITPEHYIPALLSPDLVTKFVHGPIFSTFNLADQMTIISKSNPAFVKELDKNVANKLICAAMDEAIHHTNELDNSLIISALDVLRPYISTQLHKITDQYCKTNPIYLLTSDMLYRIMLHADISEIIKMAKIVYKDNDALNDQKTTISNLADPDEALDEVAKKLVNVVLADVVQECSLISLLDTPLHNEITPIDIS